MTLSPESDGLHDIVLHGHRVFYRSPGSGPAVVLEHGITSTSATWANVLPDLAERFTIIAPDLLGHGEPAARPFPHLDDPLRFVWMLTDFIATSEPARVDAGRFGRLLRSRGQAG